MIYLSGSGRIELKITKKQAELGYHSGECAPDVEYLKGVPQIARQLKGIDPELLREELREWSDWDVSNHEENLLRLLWLACGDIVERGNQ